MGDKDKTIPKYIKFLFGGSAGMAGILVVQPLDLLKNRMQLSASKKEYTSTYHVLRNIIVKEGILALYNGLSAGLFRQATYTTTRLGVYSWLFETFSQDGHPPDFLTKAALGMTAGICGAFVGTPADVALIRMTGDGRLPPNERRNYKNVFDALIRIVREEGVLTLWRGAFPTMGRAMVVNAAQLATYSQAKQMLMNTGVFHDGILLHFCASMISGLITTTASLPVDITKTRIQNMKTIDGTPEYSGALDVLIKIVKYEGPFALWKGFTPYYFKIGPHTVLTFIFLEQMNAAYYKYVLGQSGGGKGL
ncbi:Mito carr domain containing protein [Asbolus verrucosus]|uniref:Mitochondrial 2-oxoglutarate/malate carrier protein n=1 Tax=Asbolus verrucosus TaxID=1661398 RepID=A0A482VNV7_ASBVE|nr:Mito carr domain containing protein [Asbolus verrucosus]